MGKAVKQTELQHGDQTPGGFALFLRALRAPFLVASAIPVLIGATLPFWLRPNGFSFDCILFLKTLVAMIALHAGANMANDYFDARSGADRDSATRSPFNGGSGLIQAGLLPERFFLRGSLIALGLGAAIGIHLSLVTPGWLVFGLGLVGVLAAYGYTAPPLRLGYCGLGELAIALSFGVLPVVGAYFVQTGTMSWHVVVASLPITFAIVLVLWVNEIPDVDSDSRANKRTLVVMLGARAAARGGVLTLAILIFVSLFAAVFTGCLIPLTLVAILAFGLVRTVVADCWNNYDDPKSLLEAQRTVIRLHAVLGVVIAASALIAITS
jgi:1,4-dihydroxy-2-naphthoate octaprenyltransferase